MEKKSGWHPERPSSHLTPPPLGCHSRHESDEMMKASFPGDELGAKTGVLIEGEKGEIKTKQGPLQ